MGLAKTAGITGLVIGLIITLMLSIATPVMNQICDINSKTITNQDWLGISSNLCQTFTNLAQMISNVVNP